jgi:hypothetical protein
MFLFFTFALVSCGWVSDGNNITGKWRGQEAENGTMIFYKNGKFDILNKDEKSVFSNEPKPTITWKVVTEVEPHQVYITMSVGDKTERIPLGIYKIENNKLILRETTTYIRTLGGIDMGVSRYEMPKDFSGIVKVFERVE